MIFSGDTKKLRGCRKERMVVTLTIAPGPWQLPFTHYCHLQNSRILYSGMTTSYLPRCFSAYREPVHSAKILLHSRILSEILLCIQHEMFPHLIPKAPLYQNRLESDRYPSILECSLFKGTDQILSVSLLNVSN